jgi:hypothetical protein
MTALIGFKDHITSISAAVYTSLCVADVAGDFSLPSFKAGTVDQTLSIDDAVGVAKYFIGTANTPTAFYEVGYVKEFPAIGTPANIVKVPEYGSDTSMQIQGQADSPTMEITINYVPKSWAGGKLGTSSYIGVKDRTVHLFRFSLMSEQPSSQSSPLPVQNSSYYFLGKIEALEVTPSLTDALTAKLTIAVQSEIKGAYIA